MAALLRPRACTLSQGVQRVRHQRMCWGRRISTGRVNRATENAPLSVEVVEAAKAEILACGKAEVAAMKKAHDDEMASAKAMVEAAKAKAKAAEEKARKLQDICLEAIVWIVFLVAAVVFFSVAPPQNLVALWALLPPAFKLTYLISDGISVALKRLPRV